MLFDRFIRKAGITDTVSSRKFLEAAMNTQDSQLYYTVFKFFQQRNIRLRRSPVFHAGNYCPSGYRNIIMCVSSVFDNHNM